MHDLQSICRKWKITLCGGHTEITDSVNRPVITGMLVGTVLRKNLIDKRNMKKGDQLLLTKAIAVEGTAIIAREFAVTGLRTIALTKQITLSAKWSGKVKTVTQIIAIVFVLLSLPFAEFLMGIATIITLYSGFEYFWKGRSLFKVLI